MIERIKLFVALGERLLGADQDPRMASAIENACAVNQWFTPMDIKRALSAISCDMLQQEKLEKWLEVYDVPDKNPRRVLVVMAGNIPLVGFFDLLCVLVSGHHCLVKPSAKDRVLMEYIITLLREIDPAVPVEIYDGHAPIDALIATGSDNAERYFKTHYSGTPQLLRGTRQSVAVLSGEETAEELAGLADDIWAYSGLGCRNVSLIFAPRNLEVRLQMPPMNPKYTNNYRQTKALLKMNKQPFTDWGHAVAVEGEEFPTSLSEVVIKRYNTLEEVNDWLASHDRELQCIVSNCIHHTRCVGFGMGQSPSLTDYPDEVDVISWLTLLD